MNNTNVSVDVNSILNNIDTSKSSSSKRKIKKMMFLLFIIFITTIALIVGTYAWFIGTGSASVNEFEISVKTADGIELSLDANTWTSTTLSITSSSVTTGLSSYSNHKNKWVKTAGLSPVSSAGVVDSTHSRMKFYRKTALAGTAGGYRVIADQIDNSNNESDDYITFDLFVRNGRGSSYTSSFNADDDEGIYLSKTSSVIVTPAEGVAGDKGLQNSIRVAFRQIGRIASDRATASSAQAITCNADRALVNVTGLCNVTSTTIWEPNEKAHSSSVVDYFNARCKKRLNETTYGSSCDNLTSNSFFETYALNSAISATNNVDIYDGINGYSGSSSFITNVDTLTDSEIKTSTYDERPEAFRLAPNSITKIRVYIWLEGQDVDNYDIVTKDMSVRINFGITKDMFEA